VLGLRSVDLPQDANGKEVPVNTEGEIAVRVDESPAAGLGRKAIFKGYIKPDGSYDRRLRNEVDGHRQWYITGDRGRIDQDGFFWYLARGDDGELRLSRISA